MSGDLVSAAKRPLQGAPVQTDAGIWDWIKELLTDPETFARGLRKYQAQRDKENEPIRARLGVVDDILSENRRQLERLLDVYLAGDFPRELLTDRKSRLETTIRSLERERSGLVEHLEAGNLTEGQIQTLRDFVAKVGAGIDVAEADFQTRRGVIEALNVQAVLTVEDGEKVVRAHSAPLPRVCPHCPRPSIDDRLAVLWSLSFHLCRFSMVWLCLTGAISTMG